MERLRKLLNYISEQLKVLTVSQRLAVGLSAALVVVSVLWLLQWSSRPEMVPLVNYKFSWEELEAVEEAIQATGLPYEIRGTRVYVRGTDVHNLLRVVHAADALPEGSLYDMEMVVNDPNPFEDPSSRRFKQTYAKGNELAKIIKTAPFVKDASVVINEREKRKLGGMGYSPTASVTVGLAPTKQMTPAMVEGFASLVAHAVAGLEPHNVAVIDARSMRSFRVPHPDDPAAVDYLTKAKEHERHYEEKIRNILSDIPGVQVAVTVELDTTKSVKETAKFHKPALRVENTDSTEQSSGQQPTEPGVQANLGQAVTAGPRVGRNLKETSETENFPPNLSERETVEQMPFSLQRVSAAIGIPRSFVVGVYRAGAEDAEDQPTDDDAEFSAVRDAQVKRVEEQVRNVILARDDGDVRVAVYPDMEWTSEGGGFAASPTTAAAKVDGVPSLDTVGLIEVYGPQAGMVLLALLSLGMMMRVIRRSTDELAGTDKDDEEYGDEDVIFDAGTRAVGEAAAPSSFLVGREVNDDVLRAQELSQEVTKLVENDPGGAAELITRWVNDEM